MRKWLLCRRHRSGTDCAVIAGLLVGLAVRSDIFLTAIGRGQRMPLIMTLAALAAGTGERLANSIISDLNVVEAKHGLPRLKRAEGDDVREGDSRVPP
jgi:hypothetical protein